MKTLPCPEITPRVIERFWALARKTEDDNSCWEWIGGCWKEQERTGGYGVFKVKIGGKWKRYKAHRIAYLIQHGKWPSSLVCHTCDNVKCVRGKHLFDGTPLDNHNDMKAKGRAPTGEKNARHTHPERTARGERSGQAKLSDADVEIIKLAYAARKPRDGTVNALARRFGIAREYIWVVATGRSRRTA